MKTEAQRIAIAQACGFRFAERTLTRPSGEVVTAYPLHNQVSLVPKYPSDLNAMHAAVATLPDWQQEAFAAALSFRAGFKGCFVHQLTAQDWADSFMDALKSQRISLKSTHE